MRKKVVIFGSGGHAKVVLEILEEMGGYEVVGVVEKARPVASSFLGYPVLSEEDDLKHRAGVVAIGDNWKRQQAARNILEKWPDFQFITAIHPNAQVSHRARIGQGTVVMGGAIIHPDVRIGNHCVVNTSASIDHDCLVENFASIAPGCTLGGTTQVGECTAVALGAKVIHKIKIGAHCVIGAGSVVLEPIPSHCVAYGVPCRIIRERSEGASYL